MITGFRAADDDFSGCRAAWELPPGVARVARVFPGRQPMSPSTTPAQLVAAVESKAAVVRRAGMAPFFSLKPDPVAAVAGHFDPHMRDVGAWCAAQPEPVYVTLWHEPENDPLGAAKADLRGRARAFAGVYTRCATIIKKFAGDRARIGPVHLGYGWRPGSSLVPDERVADHWRVPDELCDFAGLDLYTSNWSWADGQTLEDIPAFRRWRAWLDNDAKIMMVERGVTSNARTAPAVSQADVLARDYLFLASIGAYGYMVWHSGGATDDSSYLLTPPAARVFRQIAIAADRAAPQPVTPPPPALDRYDEGRADAYRDIADKAGQLADAAAAEALRDRAMAEGIDL